MTHFTVPHLALGKAYRQPARVEQGPGMGAPEPVPGGGGCQRDRIALTLLPVTPAVQDHQDYPRGASV